MGEWSDYFEDSPEENPANREKPGVMQELQKRLQPNDVQSSADMQRKMFRMRDEAVKRATERKAKPT